MYIYIYIYIHPGGNNFIYKPEGGLALELIINQRIYIFTFPSSIINI